MINMERLAFYYAEEFFKCCELAAILKDEIIYDKVSETKREQLDLYLIDFLNGRLTYKKISPVNNTYFTKTMFFISFFSTEFWKLELLFGFRTAVPGDSTLELFLL